MENYKVDLERVSCCNRFECKQGPSTPVNCFNEQFKCVLFAIAIKVAEDKVSDKCQCLKNDYYHLTETICPHCGKTYDEQYDRQRST